MEWVTGVKLTGLPSEEIRRLVATGQEAFLTQLLEMGFFHGDPHPGNLLKVCFILSRHAEQYLATCSRCASCCVARLAQASCISAAMVEE